MTATLEPIAAHEVYRAVLEPHHRGAGARLVRGALDVWCACFGGLLELSRDADVVVRRRVDDVVELRVHVGSPRDAAPLLADLDEDLRSCDPAEFRAVWSID